MEYTVNEGLLERAIRLWGYVFQFHLMAEECAELQLAISHFERKRATKEQVIEELVDVENMVSQLKYILRDDSETFDRIKTQKLIRLENDLRKEEYDQAQEGLR